MSIGADSLLHLPRQIVARLHQLWTNVGPRYTDKPEMNRVKLQQGVHDEDILSYEDIRFNKNSISQQVSLWASPVSQKELQLWPMKRESVAPEAAAQTKLLWDPWL